MYGQAEKLEKEREENLFHHIFNFTQTFYAIKEYLRNEYPDREKKIEDFFSNEHVNNLKRKDIANSLKHNPKDDIHYDFRAISEEIKIENKAIKHEIEMMNSWFYKGVDAVTFCNLLNEQLNQFLDREFN